MKLTKQQQRVYDFIKANRGCTTADIQRATFITCPSGRITEVRQKLEGSGRNIISIGQKKFAGSRAFEMYAVEQPHQQMSMEEFFESLPTVDNRAS